MRIRFSRRKRLFIDRECECNCDSALSTRFNLLLQTVLFAITSMFFAITSTSHIQNYKSGAQPHCAPIEPPHSFKRLQTLNTLSSWQKTSLSTGLSTTRKHNGVRQINELGIVDDSAKKKPSRASSKGSRKKRRKSPIAESGTTTVCCSASASPDGEMSPRCPTNFVRRRITRRS